MTDPTAPLSDDDLSAHLDGEADPSVAARLAADPDARARLEQLARARDLGSAPVDPLGPSQVDALIAAAMAGGAASDADHDESLAPVAPLRRGDRRGAPRWLAAAAVIVLVLGVGLIVKGLGDSSDSSSRDTAALNTNADQDSTATEKANRVPEASTGAESSGTDTADGSAGHASAEAYAEAAENAFDLGVFADEAALRTALRTSWPTEPTAAAERSRVAAADRTAERIARCATQVQTVLRLTTAPTHVGYAKIGQRPVLVFEFAGPSFEDGAPTTIVSAADPVACTPVVTFER